jgi:glycosyltransferase involved in cell wall biosynthesis
LNQNPLISCLTVTANRIQLLKEAIYCYLEQTYSPRELVIVTVVGGRHAEAIKDYIDSLGRDDIHLFVVENPDASLGYLRNKTVEFSRGDLVCQWDDDDLYHPSRLEQQFAALRDQKAEACFMSDHLQFFTDTQALYWLDWRRFGGTLEKQLLPGSMLATRSSALKYPETGNESHFGEDNYVRSKVASSMGIAVVSGESHLYVYRCHGRNTFSTKHHRSITQCCAISSAELQDKEHALRRNLGALSLPSPYFVTSREGQTVFTVYQRDLKDICNA